jgi:hypothetical protein
MDGAPAWALGTAFNIGCFPVLTAVTELHIAVDNDDVGKAKAEQCTYRYEAQGKFVHTHVPKQHKDFNDILRELRHA